MITLALAFSGSALASDLDDLAKSLYLQVGTVFNNTSPLCQAIIQDYGGGTGTEIKCYQSNLPLFLIKNDIEGAFALPTPKGNQPSVVSRYSYWEKTFSDKPGSFFQMNIRGDFSTPKESRIGCIYLDPISKYSTLIVLYTF